MTQSIEKEIKKEIKKCRKMRLPELQASFTEVVGEPTRCPNKKYLLRRIEETLREQAAQAAEAVQAQSEPEETSDGVTSDDAEQAQATDAAVTNDSMTEEEKIDAWRAKYLEIVGRITERSNVPYIRWKIRQAERGLVTVGPIASRPRTSNGEEADIKVLPLRMGAESVAEMDAAWREHGFKNRTDFLRHAIRLALTENGCPQTAERIFARETGAQAA